MVGVCLFVLRFNSYISKVTNTVFVLDEAPAVVDGKYGGLLRLEVTFASPALHLIIHQHKLKKAEEVPCSGNRSLL